MLTRRVIACLDVRAGRVVKGVRFRNHVDVGGIEELALRYRDQGADELVFYDITASPDGRGVERDWVQRTARVLDIPFCVAGGIRSVAQARQVLHAGADKVSVNSPALHDAQLVPSLAAEFGSQCVVVGIDSRRDADGEYRVHRFGGDAARMHALPLRTFDWIVEAVAQGAGEIVLNCIDADGVRAGFDLVQLRSARALCPVPLVASGGAGCAEHFAEVFKVADVDAALAASVFHSGALAIPALKQFLHQQGLPVRRSTGTAATMPGAFDVFA